MKLIMYVRKSTESEDKQVMSIPAQVRELSALMARQGHLLVGEPLSEQQSAKHPGRPVFAEVLKLVRSRKADGIVCWHLDRLARNPTDGAAIMQDLSDGRLKAVVTPDRTYTGTGDDGLMMCIIFGMATKYSVDLSKNVLRGYDEAVQRGIYPCANLPLGYMRDRETKLCIPDPERWDKVQELWRRRIAGEQVATLVDVARYEMGLRTRTPRRRTERGANRYQQRLVALAYVYKMFDNPFYAGLIRWRGKAVPGQHQAMITPTEFYDTKLDRRKKYRTHSDLPYRGLMTCGECGRGVVAERRTKPSLVSYVYYRCLGTTRSPRQCNAPAVTKSEIDRALRETIAQATLPKEIVSLLLDELAGLSRQNVEAEAEIQRRRQIELRDAQSKQGRLLQAFLAGLVTEEEMASERGRLELLVGRASAAASEPDAFTKLLGLLKAKIFSQNDALERFDDGDDTKKTALAGALCSNLVLNGRKVAPRLAEPFRTLAAFSEKSIMVGADGRSSDVDELMQRLLDACTRMSTTPCHKRAEAIIVHRLTRAADAQQ